MTSHEVRFQFGGRLALDLTWTVRYRSVQPLELLRTPNDLGAWLDAGGLPVPSIPSERDLMDALNLRESIYRSANARIDERSIGNQDRLVVNRFAAEPPPSPMIAAEGSREVRAVSCSGAAAALSVIARDAVELLTVESERLRRCHGPLCSLVFFDSSRPGTRRWCSSRRCGNRVNARAYRARQRIGADDADDRSGRDR